MLCTCALAASSSRLAVAQRYPAARGAGARDGRQPPAAAPRQRRRLMPLCAAPYSGSGYEITVTVRTLAGEKVQLTTSAVEPTVAGRLFSVVQGGSPHALAEWLTVGAAYDWGMPTEEGNVAVEELVRWAWRERWSWQRTEAGLECLEGEGAAYAGAASPAVLETVRLIGGFFDE